MSRVARSNSVFFLAGFLTRMKEAPEVLTKCVGLMTGHLESYS